MAPRFFVRFCLKMFGSGIKTLAKFSFYCSNPNHHPRSLLHGWPIGAVGI
jgi:hypothetical protein